jgi:Holliday junction resolvasome RuvABC endonuclease subunit
MSKTIFIDPSLNHIGYAILNSDNHEIEQYGVFTSKGNTIQNKLYSIFTWLDSLVTADIRSAVIEKPAPFAYSKVSTKAGKVINLSSLQKLCMAVGAMVMFFECKDIEVEFMPAENWKGKMNKEQVKTITGVSNEHAADAYLMASIYDGTLSKPTKQRA